MRQPGGIVKAAGLGDGPTQGKIAIAKLRLTMPLTTLGDFAFALWRHALPAEPPAKAESMRSCSGSRYAIRSAMRLRRMYPATRTLKNSFSGSRSCTPTRIG